MFVGGGGDCDESCSLVHQLKLEGSQPTERNTLTPLHSDGGNHGKVPLDEVRLVGQHMYVTYHT